MRITTPFFCTFLFLFILSCAGSSKPDPLHTVQDKIILKRSTDLLPDWVITAKTIREKGGRLEIKVISSGRSSLSNALYTSTNTLPEQIRTTVRDDLRDRWLKSGAAATEKDRSLSTALTLNALFPVGGLSSLSNTCTIKKEYWELYEQKTGDDTVRAYAVYHLLSTGKTELENLLKKRLAATSLTNGSAAFRGVFTGWVNGGVYTAALPPPVTVSNSVATNSEKTNG